MVFELTIAALGFFVLVGLWMVLPARQRWLEPLPIKLKHLPSQREHGRDSEGVRYTLEVDLSSLSRGESTASLPVFWKKNPLSDPIRKEIYWCEVAGKRVEKGNLMALQEGVREAIQELSWNGTLPNFYFLLSNSKGLIPVYPRGKELQVGLADSPPLVGKDIGSLFPKVVNYLLQDGRVEKREQVALRILSLTDLRLYPPECIFLYRDGEEIMIPFFSPEHGGEVFRYEEIGFPHLPMERDGLGAVLSLYDRTGSYLAQKRRIGTPFDLKVEGVGEETWGRWQATMKRVPGSLYYYARAPRLNIRIGIPLFNVGERYLALYGEEGRPLTLYFGENIRDLKVRLGHELTRKGIIPSPDDILVERA